MSLLTNAEAIAMAADVIRAAPYQDLPGAWASLLTSWTAAQIHDLVRHYIRLDPAPVARAANTLAAIRAYELAIGKSVLRYTYEGSIETPWPGATAAQLWSYLNHPDGYDTERTYHGLLQDAGWDGHVYYSAYLEPNPFPWVLWNWQGQASGPGYSNVPVGTVGWTSNQSMRGYAWQMWNGGLGPVTTSIRLDPTASVGAPTHQ